MVGAVGTEISVFEGFASTFAERCLRRFSHGQTIGSALRDARLETLENGNPLGLVYVPFVISDLRTHKIEIAATEENESTGTRTYEYREE
jgi:hypothetical protein